MKLPNLVPLLIVGILVLIGYSVRAPIGERIATSIMDHSLTTDRRNGELSQIVERLLAGTALEDRWQINKRPKKHQLNLYVIDRASESVLPTFARRLVNNCAYVGQPNVIVCDENVLMDFLRDVGVVEWHDGHPQEVEFLEAKQRAFLYWIIGHELGHVLRGHRASHFRPDGFKAMVASSTVSHKQEYEADAFVVEQLAKDTQLQTDLETMLMDVINAEVRRKVGADLPAGVGLIFDYNGDRVVKYLRAGTHPEYVVRAARMLLISAELSGDEGFKNFVEGFVRHMREGADEVPRE